LRVSVYEFKDLYRAYAIVQLEGEETRAFRALLAASEEELMELAKEVFGRVRVLKYGRGARLAETRVEFFYLDLELENYTNYSVEAYPEALTVSTNAGFREAGSAARRLVAKLLGGGRDA